MESHSSSRLYARLGVDMPFDPQSRFVTSYILTPFQLFAWRALLAIYTLTTLILVFVFWGPKEFSYFTNLCYGGLTSYFILSAIHTFSFAVQLKRWQAARYWHQGGAEKDAGSSTLPRSWLSVAMPRPLQFLYSLLWSTICTYPLIVSVVYWVLLSAKAFDTQLRTWTSISVHIMNLVLSMIEVIFVSRSTLLPWSHCLFCFALLLLYVGYAYLIHYTQGFYPYDFLDPKIKSKGATAASIVGILVAGVVSFLVAQALIFAREYTAAKIQRSGPQGSAKPRGVPREALPDATRQVSGWRFYA